MAGFFRAIFRPSSRKKVVGKQGAGYAKFLETDSISSQDVPTKDGRIPFDIPSVDIPCYTYYKIIGNLDTNSTPLIVLHGGPGAGHETLLPLGDLWSRYGVPVIFYDQIGCASSTHLPHTAGDASLWGREIFLTQLDNLIDSLNLRSDYHLLGTSWGGGLAAEYATRQPAGLRRLIIGNASASSELSQRCVELRKKDLPLKSQQTIDVAVMKNDFEDPTYQVAALEFLKRHSCRTQPFPPVITVMAKNMRETKAIRDTMFGPLLPWQRTGTSKYWTIIPRLPNINVPTLVYNGEFDITQDVGIAPFLELIPQARRATVADASGWITLEQPEKLLTLVGQFLTQDQSR